MALTAKEWERVTGVPYAKRKAELEALKKSK